MKSFLFWLLMACTPALLAGCGSSTGNGDEGCSSDADCDDGQMCDQAQDPPACVQACQDGCPAEGDSGCHKETVVRRCIRGADGCLDWVEDHDCAATAEPLCDDSSGQAVCVSPCTDECEQGDTRCVDDAVQVCILIDCRVWADDEYCPDNGQVCDNASGTAQCV